MAQTILVTGGAGCIGSHTVLQLLLGGFGVVVIDNLDNASEIAVKRVAELAGEFGKNLAFHQIYPRRAKRLKRLGTFNLLGNIWWLKLSGCAIYFQSSSGSHFSTK